MNMNVLLTASVGINASLVIRTRTAEYRRWKTIMQHTQLASVPSKISQVSPSKLPHLGRAFTDIQEQKQAPCPFTIPWAVHWY